MKRINIKTSLIFWDIVTFIVVFVSTYLMFEVVIKNIISNTSNSDFYEKLDSIEAEYFNSLDYLENKDTLVYFDYIEDILDYSVKSGVNKVKYDDSIFGIITDIHGLELKSGKKNDPDFKLELTTEVIQDLRTKASHIPEEIDLNIYTELIGKCKTRDDESFITSLYRVSDDEKYKISRELFIEDRDKFYKITTGSEYKTDDTISYEFVFNKQKYITIAEYAKHGILDPERDIVTYPIFIVADLSSDFFYLINKVRNTFLIILLIVFTLVVIIKIVTTSKITREISSISKIITQEGENIRTQGLVRKKVRDVKTDFAETSVLFDSYANLHHRLNTLGEIVSGISDKELLTAVLMETTSILDPHEEEMTVLFLDIKGFTTLTEKYQEKVFTIVNSIWVEVEKIVDKNFGKINKYIGDACLIIFQEKKGRNSSCFYALKSAIQILEKVEELREVLEIDFNFRVGLDYGTIVYGKTGTENNYELGVIGDTVNTAARLEAINKQYKTNLLMTETVVEKTLNDLKTLNPHLTFYKVDKVRPKGKFVPKELYTILVNNGTQSRFLGSQNYVLNINLKNIQLIMDNFTNGITLWKDFYQEADENERVKKHKIALDFWNETLFKIKKAYQQEPLPTMEKYISRIVTINEYELYKSDKESWFKKIRHEIQEPSEDWIKYGFIEIEK